jgi:hypothetical protein
MGQDFGLFRPALLDIPRKSFFADMILFSLPPPFTSPSWEKPGFQRWHPWLKSLGEGIDQGAHIYDCFLGHMKVTPNPIAEAFGSAIA